VFLGGAYFCGSGSWNQDARLDAIFTFVEPGLHRYTFRLDPFLPWPNRSINAGDWALVGTHYYANKAPGTILFGVLAYWPAYLLETSLGVLGNSGRRHLRTLHHHGAHGSRRSFPRLGRRRSVQPAA
jgi:hypothetical protein